MGKRAEWWGQVGVGVTETRDPIGAVSASGSGGGMLTRSPRRGEAALSSSGLWAEPNCRSVSALRVGARQATGVVAFVSGGATASRTHGTASSTAVQPPRSPSSASEASCEHKSQLVTTIAVFGSLHPPQPARRHAGRPCLVACSSHQAWLYACRKQPLTRLQGNAGFGRFFWTRLRGIK